VEVSTALKLPGSMAATEVMVVVVGRMNTIASQAGIDPIR